MATHRLPTLFIPHGAGPCFFMDWQPAHTWDRMAEWLRHVRELVGAPIRAVLVISAHWEAPAFTVNTRARHSLEFDYSGFPEYTYQLQWPAAGDPALAARVQALLAQHGLPTAKETGRGIDHGVFIPFMLIDPDATLPVVQLSLRRGLDPAEHLAAGRALAPLRDEGVLIVGSGMSFHNMQRFSRDNGAVDTASEAFDQWLEKAVMKPSPAREAALAHWSSAPSGRISHPREEHLIPLHVVAGAAGTNAGTVAFRDTVLGSVQSAFIFGGTGTELGEAGAQSAAV